MKYIVSLNGKKYEVEVNETQAELLTVSEDAPAAPVSAELENNIEKPVETNSGGKEGVVDGITIKAPMPGTIISVNINIGDTVKKDDVMFVLEAMKMENDIVAPKDGVVKQILAAKGESINTDDILAII